MVAHSFRAHSALGHTRSAQVHHPIESTVVIEGTTYDLHKTTVLDVKHEFATLKAAMNQLITVYNAMPVIHENGLGDHINEADLKGAAVAASFSRITGSIKSLSKPISREEALVLFKCYKKLQEKVLLLILYGVCEVHVDELGKGTRKVAPGLMEFCFSNLMELITGLSEALSAVLPVNFHAESDSIRVGRSRFHVHVDTNTSSGKNSRINCTAEVHMTLHTVFATLFNSNLHERINQKTGTQSPFELNTRSQSPHPNTLMATLLSQVTNPLLSGFKDTVLAQIQTVLETAITVGGTVYQNFSLHKTTVLDVRHEFATLTATTDQLSSAADLLPVDTCTGEHILDVGPKGAAMGAAISRTTGSLKNLPGPVSHEEGILLLNSYKEVQVKIISLFSTVTIRLGAVEQGAPGICEYCFNKLMEILKPLTQALSAVLPVIKDGADEAQVIHNNIQSVCDDALTRLRASTSN
ncbi:hypothetical protein Clacol_005896 [Clathrus columnatus]|uniref:Uncharacterized protein n=1 Tax=Clathrus columnatus TaxID=1419009 RepID=A0AAV5AFH7_9AGAM|nr:hypothetical protein Clacol_005896 [Clathrus columnatus]